MRNFSTLLFLCILAFQACGQATQDIGKGMLVNEKFNEELHTLLKYNVPLISVDSVYNNRDKFILLDSRERKEFDVSHIAGAHYVGYNNFNIKSLPEIPEGKQIVVYCTISYRSEKIAKKIKEMTGYTPLNLYGSIFAWVNHGYPVVDNNGKHTMKVHTHNRQLSKWVINKNIEATW